MDLNQVLQEAIKNLKFQIRETQADGMGMGLAICKRIVERHSGKIWYHSKPGKGATFYFSILQQKSHQQQSAA